MRKQRSDGIETRRRLLEVACKVFASKGYYNATIAEICQQASANVAAANYHFGSKESLYVEAWRYAFKRSLELYPPDGGVSPEAPLEDRFHGRIASLLKRIGDQENRSFEIVHKEMANPTGQLREVIHNSIKPIREGLAVLVREVLGKDASEDQVRLCQMSVTAQCFGPMLRARRQRQAPHDSGESASSHLTQNVEILAEHITRFSLAGIKEVRRQNSCGNLGGNTE